MRKVKPLLIGWGLHMAQLYFAIYCIFYPHELSYTQVGHNNTHTHTSIIYVDAVLFLAKNIVFGH